MVEPYSSGGQLAHQLLQQVSQQICSLLRINRFWMILDSGRFWNLEAIDFGGFWYLVIFGSVFSTLFWVLDGLFNLGMYLVGWSSHGAPHRRSPTHWQKPHHRPEANEPTKDLDVSTLLKGFFDSCEIHPNHPKGKAFGRIILVQTGITNLLAVEFAVKGKGTTMSLWTCSASQQKAHVIVRSTKPHSYPFITLNLSKCYDHHVAQCCWTSDAFFGQWNHWYPLGQRYLDARINTPWSIGYFSQISIPIINGNVM